MNPFFSKSKKGILGPGSGKRDPSSGSEIERLTLELIQETETALLQSFQRSIADYEDLSQGPKDNAKGPLQNRTLEYKILDEDTAKRILTTLLKEAAASRKMLAARIEHDVETGMLFNRYYSKMQIINEQTIEAYEKLQIMDRDKETFEYKQAVYKKLTGKLYRSDAIPADTGSAPDGSSPFQAADAKEAIRASKRVSRRWDILELLNLRKSVRLSESEAQWAAEDYLAQQDTETARTKEAKEAERTRREQAEAEEQTFLAKEAAAEARKKEAKAAEEAARAGMLAEKARTAEAQVEAEAAKAKAAAEATQAQEEARAAQAKAAAQAEQIKAETEAAKIRADRETAQAKMEVQAAQVRAEAEVQRAKAVKTEAKAKVEAAHAMAKAEIQRAEAVKAAALASVEAAQAQAEAEIQCANVKASQALGMTEPSPAGTIQEDVSEDDEAGQE